MVEGIAKRFDRSVEEVAYKIQLGGDMKPGDFGQLYDVTDRYQSASAFQAHLLGLRNGTAKPRKVEAGKQPSKFVYESKGKYIITGERALHYFYEHGIDGRLLEDVLSHIDELYTPGYSAWKIKGKHAVGQYHGAYIRAAVQGDLSSYVLTFELPQNGAIYINSIMRTNTLEGAEKEIASANSGMLSPDGDASTSLSYAISIERIQ